ncbi:MAG: hypothetical protein DRG71_04130, partial [Deltaproteobacteria bacterium]
SWTKRKNAWHQHEGIAKCSWPYYEYVFSIIHCASCKKGALIQERGRNIPYYDRLEALGERQ